MLYKKSTLVFSLYTVVFSNSLVPPYAVFAPSRIPTPVRRIRSNKNVRRAAVFQFNSITCLVMNYQSTIYNFQIRQYIRQMLSRAGSTNRMRIFKATAAMQSFLLFTLHIERRMWRGIGPYCDSISDTNEHGLHPREQE